MYTFLSVLVGSISAIVITVLLTFKGFTHTKRMEVIPPKSNPFPTRPVEMDEIERKLNQAHAINQANSSQSDSSSPTNEPAHTPTAPPAMDQVLRVLQDVFGPEQPPHEGGN